MKSTLVQHNKIIIVKVGEELSFLITQQRIIMMIAWWSQSQTNSEIPFQLHINLNIMNIFEQTDRKRFVQLLYYGHMGIIKSKIFPKSSNIQPLVKNPVLPSFQSTNIDYLFLTQGKINQGRIKLLNQIRIS